jgi:hypothetical protein
VGAAPDQRHENPLTFGGSSVQYVKTRAWKENTTEEMAPKQGIFEVFTLS